MSPRTGRPTKDESVKKNIRLEIRLTNDENEMLSKLAEQLGLSKTNTILKALQLLKENR